MKLTFVQVSAFAAKWDALGFDDEDLQALEAAIMEHPTAGAVMSGTGGVRKFDSRRHQCVAGKVAPLAFAISFSLRAPSAT